MNANIIENDICSKCDNITNNFRTFVKCQHIICLNCFEDYFLENDVKMNENMKLKCIVEECNNIADISIEVFINIIDNIGNKILTNKYSKVYYSKEFVNRFLNYFFHARIDHYNEICFDINTFIFCMDPWTNCFHHRPRIIEALYIIWLIIFQVLFFYVMPISLQICFRNLYYNFIRKIIYKYYKLLVIPLIIAEELLTLIYFFPFGVLHYFYLLINLLLSIFS